jgi:hypothetical protein
MTDVKLGRELAFALTPFDASAFALGRGLVEVGLFKIIQLREIHLRLKTLRSLV